jgi:hypothetical protein
LFSHFHASFQKLLGFNVLGVLSAEGAILATLQTVRSILLVLNRVVVPLLAFFASECDFNSCACSHSFGTSYFIYPLKKYGRRALPPCVWTDEAIRGAKLRTKIDLSSDR